MSGSEALVTVDRVNLAFGGVDVLHDVSFTVREQTIASIIGPNGAGKTSLLNCLSGIYRPGSGSIQLAGEEITHLAQHRIARLGLTRTFQTPALFPGLSVVENLMVGRYARNSSGVLSCMVGLPGIRREERRNRAHAESLMELLQVSHLRRAPVTDLAYGMQKRVELGRALAQEPRVLLLDEPMAGMTLEEKEDMCALLLTARSEFGITTILVEHDMGVVMDLSDEVVVLNFGKKLVSGPATVVKNDPAVVAAYLGSTTDSPKGLVS